MASSGGAFLSGAEDPAKQPLTPSKDKSSGESNFAPHRVLVMVIAVVAAVILLALIAVNLSPHNRESRPGSFQQLSTDFNCNTKDNRGEWSHAKKEFCCERKGISCDDGEDFNCYTKDNRDEWSNAKKTWCCDNKDIGCDGGGDSDFNCRTKDNREQWAPAKKKWCCENKHIGCEMACSGAACPDKPNCNDYRTDWIPSRREYCCRHGHQEACEDHNCDTKEHMEPSKIDWCCKTENKHCDEYNCNTKEAWSPTKREWCCENKHKGCRMCGSSPCPGSG
jgi:hypothetical protein